MPLPESIQRASRSLVFLEIERGAGEGGYATGFVVGPAGEIVTTAHTLHEATKVEARLLGAAKAVRCAVVATELKHDLALLKADARDWTPLPLWRGEAIGVGREVALIGFPHADIFRPPLVMAMRGIVGNRYRLGENEVYVLDVNASEGMSGGPVFLASSGEAIGVLAGRLDPGRMRARMRGAAPEAVRELPAERASIAFAPVVEQVIALLGRRAK